MNNSAILVTNDDGQHSPLLLPFVSALKDTFPQHELRVVVPDKEQSWVSQSVSRFSALETNAREFCGLQGFTATGTPADCASLGIHNLYPDQPAHAFSGINLGVNAGLAYFLSSGTVGGASESMLTFCRSVAFSAEVPRWVYDAWKKDDRETLDGAVKDWTRLAKTSSKIARQLVENSAWQHASFISVNMPWSATPDTPVRLTRLAETYFGPLFSKVDEGLYKHKHDRLSVLEKPSSSTEEIESHAQGEFPFNAQLIDSPPWPRDWSIKSELPCDLDILARGEVSLTPITYRITSPNLPPLESFIGS